MADRYISRECLLKELGGFLYCPSCGAKMEEG